MAGFRFLECIDARTGARGFTVDLDSWWKFNDEYAVFRTQGEIPNIVQVGELEPDPTKTDEMIFEMEKSDVAKRKEIKLAIARRSLQIMASYHSCAKILKTDVCFNAAATGLVGKISNAFGHNYAKRRMSLELSNHVNYTDCKGDEPLGTAVGLNNPTYGRYIIHAAVKASNGINGNPLYLSRNCMDEVLTFYDAANMRRHFELPENAQLLKLKNQKELIRQIALDSSTEDAMMTLDGLDAMAMTNMMGELRDALGEAGIDPISYYRLFPDLGEQDGFCDDED
ncbi:hypothetical protein FWF74_03325 [Candidatus Saccharibacteria bacterium]|nr:hypothetical protein [Candidatus Saccharibacteria bacterium]MCL1962880.1 hypothetical protein [Candidatus Saccharibacteria bacterium]